MATEQALSLPYIRSLLRRLTELEDEFERLNTIELPNDDVANAYSWFLKAESEATGVEVLAQDAVDFVAQGNSAAAFTAGKNVAITRTDGQVKMAAGITARAGTGTDRGPWGRFSFIDGTGINFTVVNDNPNTEIDVTANALGYGVKVRTTPSSTGTPGTTYGPRSRLNFIEGSGIGLIVADDSGADLEIEITPSVKFAGSGSATTAAHSDHTHGGGGGLSTTVVICCFTGGTTYTTHSLTFTSGSLTSYPTPTTSSSPC